MNKPLIAGDCTVRRAVPEDAPALLGLIKALAEYEKLTPPDGDAAARLAQGIDTLRFQAFLAELNGVPVGYAVAFETYGTFIAAPKYYVEDVFVLPEHRGNGIGRALFAVLATEATYRGCEMMEWTALDWNKPAIEFYEGMGAKLMQEWRLLRLDKEAMARLATDAP